eukprot:10202688-Karenia_brevis.AAC.1
MAVITSMFTTIMPPQGHRDKKNCDCRTILHRMNAYGDVPVVFACDLNDQVVDIEVLHSAVEHGIIIDVAAEWAHLHGHQPHPTYYSRAGDKHDVSPGPGKTRIDFVFVNHIMWAAITDFKREPQYALEKHVPHCMTINFHVFNATVSVIQHEPPFDLESFRKDANMTFDQIMSTPCCSHIDIYREIIDPHETQCTPHDIFSSLSDMRQEDTDKRYEIVSAAAIAYLQQNGAVIPPKARRGTLPNIKDRSAGPSRTFNPANNEQLKHLRKLLRQCKDIHDALLNATKTTKSLNSYNHAQNVWRKI